MPHDFSPRNDRPRFKIGDRVHIKPTKRLSHSGVIGTVRGVTESRWLQTLDKYMVRVEGLSDDLEVYDIELSGLHK